jgi:hypothetical protein
MRSERFKCALQGVINNTNGKKEKGKKNIFDSSIDTKAHGKRHSGTAQAN